MPHAVDLFYPVPDVDVADWYGCADLFMGEVLRRFDSTAGTKDFRALLTGISRQPNVSRAAVFARRELERRVGRLGLVFQTAMTALDRSKSPTRIYGELDRLEDGRFQIVARRRRNARSIWPRVGRGDDVTVETTFEFDPFGDEQFDVYLAYREGRHFAEFLKVAIVARSVIVFRFVHGRWNRLGVYGLERKLDVGSRYSLRVALRHAAPAVVVSVAGQTITHALDAPISAKGARVGLGSYGGIVRLTAPKITEK